jgi:tetratricopeptide (TPR) repeat protein
MTTEEEFCRRYLEAAAILERGDALSARREFELLTLEAPRFAPAWDGLGSCHEREGALDRAGECYRKAMRLDRHNWHSRYHWGLALHRAGELREAIRWLREAAKLAPQERAIHRCLGLCHFDQGAYAEAIRCYRRALEQPERDVRDAELYVDIGKAESESGDFEAADKAYERACLLSPDDAAVYYHWALVTARQGALEDAERLAVRACAMDPRSLRFRLLPVRLAMDGGRWEAAEARIQELERTAGSGRLAQALRAELARERGRPEEARSLALQALAMDGPLSDHAVDSALATLRELRGLLARLHGFRLVVEVFCQEQSYFRPYVVLAENEEQAEEFVRELQDTLDPAAWEIAETEHFPHDGEALAGVYHLLLTRVLFPREERQGLKT